MDRFTLRLWDGNRTATSSAPYFDPREYEGIGVGLTVYQDGFPIQSYAHPDTDSARLALAENPCRTRTASGLVLVNP